MSTHQVTPGKDWRAAVRWVRGRMVTIVHEESEWSLTSSPVLYFFVFRDDERCRAFFQEESLVLFVAMGMAAGLSHEAQNEEILHDGSSDQ